MIGRTPCPGIPGEVKARAVRCFSRRSAQLPTGVASGSAFQGKAGQIHPAATARKACLCRSDEVLHRNIWLPSSWDKLAQAKLSAVMRSSQANQVKIWLGIVPSHCSPVRAPSPLGAHGVPLRGCFDGERELGIFLRL